MEKGVELVACGCVSFVKMSEFSLPVQHFFILQDAIYDSSRKARHIMNSSKLSHWHHHTRIRVDRD